LKPYVTGKLFFQYIKGIFVPYLNEPRESEEFEACEAILLMDNCSHHISNDIIAVFTRVRVRVITFATHTTHIFRMLDIMLFGALKKYAIDIETLDEEQSAAAFLLKVHHDSKKTTAEINITDAFISIGLTQDIEQTVSGLLFNKEKFRQSRGFESLSK
jgi:hypothetical protein